MAEPLYRRIAEELRARIETGDLQPGQMVTELELRDQYNVSRNTIRDALRWLASRGMVEARTGQGTFVTERIDPFITTLSVELGGTRLSSEGMGPERPPLSSPPRVEIEEAFGAIAAMLSLPAGNEVVSRQENRFIDGTPWSLQTSYYPMELVEKGARRLLGTRNIEQGVLAYLKETLGLHQVGYRDLIQVSPPNMTEAAFFRLPDDGRTPVITVRRTSYSADGFPFRAAITVYPADRNQLLIESGQVPDSGAW